MRANWIVCSEWCGLHGLYTLLGAADWLSAGSNVTQPCANKMISAAAVALLGPL